jgi:ketosteroid isomerase-like protein
MTTTSEKVAIAKKIEQWTQAIASKDAGAVSRFFTSDVVTFDLAPPLKHSGFDGKALQEWFKTWQSNISYEVTDQVIEAGDTIAVARSLAHMTGTKTNGDKVDLWTRSTVCFRKEGEEWKVMHVHSSVPFLMDGSFKAAVDLKP